MYGSEWGNPTDYSRTPERRPRKFRSARGPARVAVPLLVGAILAQVAIAVIEVVNVMLLTDAIQDRSGGFDKIDQRDHLATITGLIQLVSFLAAGIAFMVWMTRAYDNVEALTPDVPRHWTGWAWLGWIIPILNLWRPKQIVNDMWRSTGRAYVPAWVLGWWVLWLACGLADRVLFRIPVDSVEQYRWLGGASVVVSVALMVTAFLAIRLVRRITELQEEQAARPKPPPPDDDDRRGRTARVGEDGVPEGFTIKPAWAPSDGA
ncbi:MAG TPA: DUF4328 domain-containing protein [Solirubrobacteraceae bacterium]|jgi:hypothetical protein